MLYGFPKGRLDHSARFLRAENVEPLSRLGYFVFGAYARASNTDLKKANETFGIGQKKVCLARARQTHQNKTKNQL